MAGFCVWITGRFSGTSSPGSALHDVNDFVLSPERATHKKAQGNALGIGYVLFCTLKGCDNLLLELVAPLQGAGNGFLQPGAMPRADLSRPFRAQGRGTFEECVPSVSTLLKRFCYKKQENSITV